MLLRISDGSRWVEVKGERGWRRVDSVEAAAGEKEADAKEEGKKDEEGRGDEEGEEEAGKVVEVDWGGGRGRGRGKGG